MPIIGIDASRASMIQKTGTEQYSFYLIRELLNQAAALGQSQHESKKFSYRLYAKEQLPREIVDAATSAHAEIKTMRAPRLWTQGRLALEMLVQRPGVLFIPSHTIPWIHPAHTVVTCHDIAFEFYPDAYAPNQLRELKRATRQMVEWARKIIVPSESTKRDLVSVYGARADKIEVIHHGVDREFAVPQSTEAIQETLHEFSLRAPYFLSIGRIEKRKNTLRLISAFHRAVSQNHVPHHLVLAGSNGYGAQEVRAAIDEYRLRDRVHMLGYVDKPRALRLLAGAEGLVFPSLYEGFGMPLLEAMAMGKLVLTSKAPWAQEVAGDAALFVDPKDEEAIANGIVRLVQDQPLRSQLASLATQQANKFSWDECARKTRNILTSLL